METTKSLTVNIDGAYESGIVLANMELTLQNLVKIDPVDTGSTQIGLPITSDCKVSTVIRVRPGDNLVLAGLVTSRDTNDRQRIPLPFGLELPGYANDQMENNELVILVKP